MKLAFPKLAHLALGAALLALPAGAETAPTAPGAEAGPPIVRKVLKKSFDDALFSLKNAVTDQGLVVDQVNRVGEMLARTAKAAGAQQTLYTHAVTLGFCSAKWSRAAMAADRDNIAYCPYTIFLYELPDTPGEVVIGHRRYPGASMQPVNALLDKIVEDTATGF
ncbi:DUF302 domain-containing protein [Acidimangrovimonas sediminis]|uniref:DUF302 domain-containing protein n=1 Tax=Acidimangrovimonas sediminis TaxID=2056283 RepID=UPI000C8104E3|nr:DUF302 domain-containing protein [Acidimangrovimonas sediminis]